MRKVWVTVITYNNEKAINGCIGSLLNSDLVTSGLYEWYIEIINNHSNFHLNPDFEPHVRVHHQTLRPDWAYVGYFTRDCNSALIRAIKDLNNPLNDQVIILQDDVCVKPDFMSKLVERHNSGLEFIMSGIGDALNSWVPSAVQKIGLYDERFGTGFHEGDYILRAIQKLGTKCSIGDIAHGREWNRTDNGQFYRSDSGQANADSPENTTRAESDLVICPPFTQEQLGNVYKRSAHVWHEPLWKQKWARHTFYNWSEDFKHNVIPTLKQTLPNYILYPYFEKNITGIYDETYYLSIDGNPVIANGAPVELPLYCNIVYYGSNSRHEW